MGVVCVDYILRIVFFFFVFSDDFNSGANLPLSLHYEENDFSYLTCKYNR